MNEGDVRNLEAVLERIKSQSQEGNIFITQHAHQEMVEEDITLDDVMETISTGSILENYPEHRRGACCLLGGSIKAGRSIHIVCTTARPVLIIITVYEPKPPKWITPTQRR